MLKVVINGLLGQMGQVIAEQIENRDDMELVAGIITDTNSYTGNIEVYDDIMSFDGPCDVIIDFSHPDALSDLLNYAKNKEIALVIGTTGYGNEDISLIEKAARAIPIFYSANMSLGINLLLSLVHKAASILSDDFDIEVIEKHHNQKIDAPSGTAYMIADKINQAFNNSKAYKFGRHTKTEKRSHKEIGIHAIRGGTIVGEHTVLFAGLDETVEIKHNASSKSVFAKGALRAAEFIVAQDKGLFDMNDLINK